MPTIEIIAINSEELDLNQDDFEIAIVQENNLVSHRNLFYDFLLQQNGRIIHLGNPDLKANSENGFYAGQLVDWEFKSEANFQFRKEYIDEIGRLLKIAMSKSTDNKVYFLTDYQWGPEIAEISTVNGFTEFWDKHESEGLRLNTLYKIK